MYIVIGTNIKGLLSILNVKKNPLLILLFIRVHYSFKRLIIIIIRLTFKYK